MIKLFNFIFCIKTFSRFTMLTFVFTLDLALAQKTPTMTPDMLSAKALLESVLAKRLSSGIATKLDKETYTIGTFLDIREIQPEKKKTDESKDEPMSDLMLGHLDPDAIMKSMGGQEEKQAAQKLLANYMIKSVDVSLGVKEDIPQESKAEVEKWLSDRVKSEFGKNGKVIVSTIKAIPKKPEPLPAPKDFWDWLNVFQPLAGQLILAFAIILGILMWHSMSKKNKEEVEATGNQGLGAGANAGVQIRKKKSKKLMIKMQKLWVL